MTRSQVTDLMGGSRTLQEWLDNCNTVKSAFGGDYPNWWYEMIIISGIANETLDKIGTDTIIEITN